MCFARLLLTASLILAAALGARAQATDASVKMVGQVSATVAVSAGTPAQVHGGRVQAASRQVDLQTAVVTLSGADTGRTELILPVRLRSNAAYTLSASVRAKGASLVSVSVTSTRATGRFVAEGAVDTIKIAEPIDSQTRTPHPGNAPSEGFPLTARPR